MINKGKIIGATMIAVLFGSLFVIISIITEVKIALLTYAITAILELWVGLAVWLVEDRN